MSASASAPSSPGYQVMSTAPARVAQGISTGEPALTTTTVRGLTSSTASTSSRWRPGQRQVGAVVALGLPLPVGADDDHGDVGLGGGAHRALELVARVRRRGADARPHDGGGGGPRPDVDGQLVGVSRRRGRPSPRPARSRRRRSWSHATGSVLSTTTAPSRRSTARPALSSPSRQAPDTSGTNVADSRTEHAPDGELRLRGADPQDPGGVRRLRRHGSAGQRRGCRSTRCRASRVAAEQPQVDRREARVDPAAHLGGDGRHPGAAPPAPRPRAGAGAGSPRSCRRPWRAGRRWAR